MREILQFGLDSTYTRLLKGLDDLTDEEARQCSAGLSPIIWQAGHIALTDHNFAVRAGSQHTPPPGYAELFKAGTGGDAAYPSLHDVRVALEQGQRALEDIVQAADLARAIESPVYHNAGEMLVFACYHRGYHVGKIMTLRGLLGRSPLFGAARPPAPGPAR
jgi:uncharacterized damage-inducible protein DinB